MEADGAIERYLYEVNDSRGNKFYTELFQNRQESPMFAFMCARVCSRVCVRACLFARV